MVRPTASGMLWQTAYESQAKGPTVNGVPGTISRASTFWASLFLPISPTPPSGMTRSVSVTEQRHLIGGLLRLRGDLRPGRLGGEEDRERREVRHERGAQCRLM